MNADDVEIIERKRVYDGYSKLDAFHLKHRRFDGSWSDVISRELLERGNAVCVLPYDPFRDEVVLIEQFRIGAHAAGLPPWQTEIVAGVVEEGETEEDVARRELIEECGCEATGLHFVCQGLSSSGILSEISTVYCATVDASGAAGVFGVAGEHEDIRAFALSFEDAMAQVRDGSFQHLQGIAAFQWLEANRDRLRNRSGERDNG